MSKSKIPEAEKFISTCNIPWNIPIQERAVYILKKYAELVRAETLKLASQEAEIEGDEGSDFNGISINKQSILDLVNHKNLEIK